MNVGRLLGRRRLWAVAGAVGLLALAGCGGADRYPVHGKLVYEDNEQPVSELDGFDVTFTSEALKVSARGMIQPDGTFQLGTEKDNDGAPPGEYIVTLTQPVREPDRPFVGNPVVDRYYEDPSKSDLKAVVKPEKNEFVFKLRRIKKSGR
jgi:hypothetical protein